MSRKPLLLITSLALLSLAHSGASKGAQADYPYSPVTTIELSRFGCLRVYDFAVGPNSLVVLCRTEGGKLILHDVEAGGGHLRSMALQGLDHSSYVLAVSARNEVAVLGRGLPLRYSELVVISAERVATEVQKLDQLLFDLRYIGDETIIAANGQGVFSLPLDGDRRVRLTRVADVSSRYPLLVYDRGGIPQVMDMTFGSFPVTASSQPVGPSPPLQLPEAKNLPLFREDGSVVPMFYAGDVSASGNLCVLMAGFRHDEGALMVVLGNNGEVRKKIRLGLARHTHAITTTHPGGHEMPIALRVGSNLAYTLALTGTRISVYAIPGI